MLVTEERTARGIKDLKGSKITFQELVAKLKSYEGCLVELTRVRDVGLHPVIVRSIETCQINQVDVQEDAWFKLHLENEQDHYYYFKSSIECILQNGTTYYIIQTNNTYFEFKVKEEVCHSKRLKNYIDGMRNSLGVFRFTDTLTYDDFLEFLDNFEDYNYTKVSVLDGNGNHVTGQIDEVITSRARVGFCIILDNGEHTTIDFERENIVSIVDIKNSRNKYFMIYELDSITPLILE
ncbi:hypothetical protein P4493_04205 [Bacillus thuringiensis]|uniref:Uncharacterized protein n=3 Tax=Bacillus thuringiensis TaxID=1428 RepID=A0A0B5NP32_BACTU|nr:MULTISPECIES: hypothetical protein [Bacillus]EAO56896.1 hypothetical protein RBTH_07426 [Bacillus thuringiensis serovar israelensis ATCC 35646]MEC2535479.1 hypothetical protein [Bacillus cereus]MED1153807.1 hypothetical protein [Bacillus paranthracis]OUB09334.1 hypothetical protein BK708_32940 [Bacillus thuringiensis serovar yunnanensis]AFQ30119.1 hypothetical protein BTF1_30092 [Bacillus thuringiensis HD-789]